MADVGHTASMDYTGNKYQGDPFICTLPTSGLVFQTPHLPPFPSGSLFALSLEMESREVLVPQSRQYSAVLLEEVFDR